MESFLKCNQVRIHFFLLAIEMNSGIIISLGSLSTAEIYFLINIPNLLTDGKPDLDVWDINSLFHSQAEYIKGTVIGYWYFVKITKIYLAR